jgi:hypothetical protein
MWGMRNRIAHGCLLVEPAIVRSTVGRDLTVMVEAVRAPSSRSPEADKPPSRPLAWAPKLAPRVAFGVDAVAMRQRPSRAVTWHLTLRNPSLDFAGPPETSPRGGNAETHVSAT